MNAVVLLDPARLDRPDTEVRHEPFPFMIAHGQLPDDARGDLERDFPRYTSAGFFPYDPADCGPSINALVERLTAPEFASAVGKRLGIENLGHYPTLITLCRSLNKRHGTIHTDSRSKIATALLYLNAQWPDTS
ncbi:MAG TPA: 2OG-Fe(II) oxygenase, partial [Dyella sp.]|nr:2OG-Fe(II) oxygenase [Dyella sp.]